MMGWAILLFVMGGALYFFETYVKKTKDQTDAKLPERLGHMLTQEFNEHSAADFSYPRCHAAVSWLASQEARRLLYRYQAKQRLADQVSVFDNPKTRMAATDGLASVYADRIAPIFGEALTTTARSDPHLFYTRFERCFQSAKSMAAV